MQISNAFRRMTRKDSDKLNIITFCPKNHKYIESLAKTGHNFYLWTSGVQDNVWNNDLGKRPKNVFSVGSIDHIEYFDLIIVHDRFEQYSIGTQISSSLNIPMILVDHVSINTMTQSPILSTVNINATQQELDSLSIHDIRVETDGVYGWSGISVSIPYGPSEEYDGDAVINDGSIVWLDKECPTQIAEQINQCLPDNIKLEAYTNQNMGINGRVLFNAFNNVTPSCIEAMRRGVTVISLRTPDTEKYFVDGKDGILIDNLEEFRTIINKWDIFKDIAIHAAKRSWESNNLNNFVEKWNATFKFVCDSVYVKGI